MMIILFNYELYAAIKKYTLIKIAITIKCHSGAHTPFKRALFKSTHTHTCTNAYMKYACLHIQKNM